MSYILEALKKAEQARGFGQVLGIDSPHDQPPPRAPRRWPWVVVAVLLLNALAVAGLWTWWRGGDGTGDSTAPTVRPVEPVVEASPGNLAMPPPVASRPDPAPRAGTAAPPVQPDSAGRPAAEPTPPPPVVTRRPLRPLPLPETLPISTPAPVQGPTPAAAEPPQGREIAAPVPRPSGAMTVPADVVELRAPMPPSPPQAEPAWKSLPLWPLVPERILRQVKERLVLNVHVYSEIPEDRFVLLDMKKFREGEQISEELRLEEITREGAILAVPSGRFRLGSR